MYHRIFSLLVFSLLFGISHTANADWYVGADGTNLEYRMSFTYGREKYKFSPSRVRIGYLSGNAGIEFQAYTEEEDTINPGGLNVYLKAEETFGAHFVYIAEDINTFLTLGAVRTKITNTLVDFDVSDEDVVVLLGISAGYEFDIAPGLDVSLGYNYYEGKTRLPNTTVPVPGSTSNRISSVLSGFSVGLRYTF